MKAPAPQQAPLTFEDWSSLHAHLLWCYRGEVAAAHRQMTSRCQQLSAWWLLHGSVTVRRDGHTWRARAGQWMFCGPHPRQQVFSSDARILSINFKLEWPSGDSLADPLLIVPAAAHPALGRAATALVHCVGRHFPHIGTALQPQPADLTSFFETQQRFAVWTHIFLQTLLDAGVVPTRMGKLDPRVLKALRLLDHHDWRLPFREKQLATSVGLSAGHLDRLFVQNLGLTPRAHFHKRRVASATARLADTSVPAKRIAFDLGFSSASHFSHWLRKAVGKCPRELRKDLVAQTPAGGSRAARCG